MANLKTPNFRFGVVTPRAAYYVCAAAIIRAGGHVGLGVEQTTWLSNDQMGNILRIADIEIAFEETRRAVVPDAASRLCCLWVAEDTPNGQAHIQRMLGESIFLLRVAIIASLRVTRADTQWFDLYAKQPREEYILNYWNSVPYANSNPSWEFLVEGVIAAIDKAELDFVRKNGAHTKLNG